MTNSTDVYWDVDGQSLQTYAWNVTTWGGSARKPPPLRGDDLLVPHVPGRRWYPKTPDSRVVSLDMWVLGAAHDGTILDEQAFQANWRSLVDLLYQPDRQMTLTKRWKDANGVVQSASALAQYHDGLEPGMTGQRRATFGVDLFLADPAFYGPEQTVRLALPDTPSATIAVGGDYATTRIGATFTGPLDAPQVTNTTRDPDVWMRFGASIADSETADVDVQGWTAVQHTAGGPVKSIGAVSHSGAYPWLTLGPGPTDVTLSAQSGTGFVDLSWQPVFW